MKPLALLSLSFSALASAGEILIHEGPTVATPGLSIQLPGGKESGAPLDLIFIKQFFADEKLLAGGELDPDTKEVIRLPATEAIPVALATVQPNDSKHAYVTKLELLKFDPKDLFGRGFYLITISVNGSEEHRIVLNNGSVIEPRLKEVK